MNETLVINEIYLSIQGESTLAGLPCVFVRLTACNLRCSYCDTAYAFTEGTKWPLRAVHDRILQLSKPYLPRGQRPLVELTGGEPLLQRRSLNLMQQLCDEGYTVLLETSGAHDISPVDSRVRRIMDLKCPSSGEISRNRWENLQYLQPTDELKFVIGTYEDYEWAKEQVLRRHLFNRCPILFSWVAPLLPEQHDTSLKPAPTDHRSLTRQELVEQIVADALPVRFQLQMHKFIWTPDQRGV